MSSWRESASQQAQDDLDGLLNAVVPLAVQLLDKHGEFIPYGGAIPKVGEPEIVGGHTGAEHPMSADVIDLVVAGLRQRRDQLRCAAIVADVRTGDGDAVRVELEHHEGPTVMVLLPYKKKRFGRGVEYGDLVATLGRSQIWVD